MPDITPRQAAVVMDMHGCPNRCRHCWLGHHPNRKAPIEDLKWVVDQFREWSRPGESKPFFEKLGVMTWFREPDYAHNHRELWQLEKDLSDEGAAKRFQLLSIWRLARDESYAAWAKAQGTNVCQITLFGMEQKTDWFVGRRGAFNDCLIATERLLNVGIAPRWQLILYKPVIEDLTELVALMKKLELENRSEAIGSAFSCFLNTSSPDGAAFDLEHMRPDTDDLWRIPDYLAEKTLAHFQKSTLEDCLGQSESEQVERLIEKNEPLNDMPDLAFMVTPNFDVYPNSGEMTEWWKLGNLKTDGIDRVMANYLNDKTVGLRLNHNVPISDLAREFGRPANKQIYGEADLVRRWFKEYGGRHQEKC